MPVDIPQDYQDHPRATRLVPLKGALHLLVVAIVRRDEIGADQQQDDLSGFEIAIDLARPFGAGGDLPVMPSRDQVQALQELEVRLELVPQRLA